MSKKNRRRNRTNNAPRLAYHDPYGGSPAPVTLGAGEGVEYLPVRVDGTFDEYRLPLMSSLSVADVMDFSEAAGDDGNAFTMAFYRFACRYIPKDVIDTLPMSELGVLAEAWAEAGDAGKS